jgi:NADPH2:quinone reductase
MKITEGKGVNVVYDPVGESSWSPDFGRTLTIGMIIPSLKCVAWNSRIVVVGFAAGTIEKVPANLLLLKQCSIVGLYWGGNTSAYDTPNPNKTADKKRRIRNTRSRS